MRCLTERGTATRLIVAIAGVALLAVVQSADAQTPQRRAQGGPPSAAPAPTRRGVAHEVHRHRSYPLASTDISAYGYVPVIVAADGRVFADLGFGFEPIVRACNYTASQGSAGQGYPAPAYTPPTMIMPTPLNPEEAARQAASDSAARANANPSSSSPPTAATSCWSRDPQGTVIVTRQ